MKKAIATLIVSCAALGLWLGGSSYAAHSDRQCNGCHVPHWAVAESDTDYGVPLWSPAHTQDGLKYAYTMYTSKGMTTLEVVQAPQPDGPSKLCLGCHDGSYPYLTDKVQTFRWYPAVFQGEDLARSHPVSFVYDSALAERSGGRLHNPVTTNAGLGDTRSISQALLDSKEKMQCTSCHDVHTSGIGEAMLRYDWNSTGMDEYGNSVPKTDNIMCRVCHNK